MSSLFGSSGKSTPPPDMATRKQAFMDSYRQEMALTNAQELMTKCNEKCFAKCVAKPGSSLSGSEQTCLSNCLQRYMEAFNIVSRTYISRVQKERLSEIA
ncbi:Tim10/DDP family zinc finger-domain-containing protein [Fomitopsis serialis]|uniref:Tim10/DDP family zinc finger-domain-containing protein n=1 Tax=Fomitopsis serialis TaxID=139415 RepID=UPI002007AFF0|nr:Tim10/DDP family zinc finger-domain-containing protein [Neoantrodia serialis]KAH9925542.1 Tim10/DDP family zinc finger-domain-containing protein [Neoantrodia serialis]